MNTSTLGKSLVVLVILDILFCLPQQSLAQVVGATLSGTITDPSGAVVPNAQVSVKNTATGVTREVTADNAGLYLAPNLLPGNYEVTVTSPGFSTARQSNVELGVGAEQRLNVSLKVGQTSQTVEVTEAAPQIQLTSSTLSDEVESTTVRELPLNGRDWASLATLSPGVNAIENQMPFDAGAVRGNRGFGAQLTIAGGRPTQNNYRLDGLSINDYGNGGPGSVLGVSLGVDAIQEFSVLTGNYSAEYGRTSGGVVNAISKSGTNAFHGDAYEFLRNDAVDAEDFFLSSANQPKAPYKRNQFGVAAGGPIIKDRTFIFGDYEGIRSSKGVTTPINVPSDNARLGILAGGTPLPAGAPCPNPATQTNLAPGLATTCVDNNAARYLALYPHANGPVNGNKGVFAFPALQIAEENFVTVRGDHKINDKDSIFATYMFDRTPFTQPDPFNNVRYLDQTSRHIAALEWSHVISPALINNARLGYNRNFVINYQPVSASNPAAADLSLGSFPGGDNPQIRIGGGFKAMSPGLIGGFSHHIWNSLQFYDDAFLTHGAHALKFGFAMENMRYNFFQSYNPDGIWTFTSLANFLTNHPKSLEGGLPSPDTPRALRQTLFGGYVEDDWRLRHNLTLNLGLRYEMDTVLKEEQGKLTNLASISDALPYCGTTDPTLTTLITPADQFAGRPGIPGCTGAAPYYSNPTTLNFEPRLGFAWDPRGDGKMAVRGGFAIFDVLPLPGYFYTQQGIETPFFLTGIVHNSSTAPLAGLLGVPASDTTSAFNMIGSNDLTAAFMEKNPKRNYIEQWNLNVQRQITPSLTATLGYIGSHGVHMLIRGDDSNMVIPCPPSCPNGAPQIPDRVLWPFNPTGQDLRINKNFGGTRFLMYGTNSSYEAGQINIQKRMSHGFQFGGSYTYSKAMDNDSATIAGDAFANSITSWFWFDPQISRAVSDFNVTHSAAINGIWDVPGLKSLHGIVGGLVNGWEMGSILKLNSGIPTTPLIAGDPLGVENAGSDLFSIPDRVPGCNPANNNYRSNPGGIFLGYINYSCFTLPTAPASLASQCNPNSASAQTGFYKAATPAPAGTVYCANLLGNAGRNSVVGPGLFNLDFSLYKNFAVRKISESASVQFRAEFFNILNRANFNPPNAFFGSGNAQIFNADGSTNGGGGLESLATQPRDIQFALKLIW